MGVAAALEEEAHLAWVADDFHITHLLTHRFPSVGNSGDLLDTVPVRHGMELILVPVPSWLNHRRRKDTRGPALPCGTYVSQAATARPSAHSKEAHVHARAQRRPTPTACRGTEHRTPVWAGDAG